MPLNDQIADLYEGNGNPHAAVGEFRRTPVLVPLINDGLLTAELGGIRWIYAFSDEDALARFAATQNMVSTDSVDDWQYASVRGARLLDVVVPALQVPAGVALDAGSERGMAFPPVSGIVPDSAAIDIAATPAGQDGQGGPA